MESYHLIYQSQWLQPMAPADLDALLRECRAYNRLHNITGLLLHTAEGRFVQVLEGPRAAVRRLYYHGILSDPRHYHCRVLGEGPWAQRSFADWAMGFCLAQTPDLRTLLGESGSDSLGLVSRPYPRAQLLAMVNGFLARHPATTWQEQP